MHLTALVFTILSSRFFVQALVSFPANANHQFTVNLDQTEPRLSHTRNDLTPTSTYYNLRTQPTTVYRPVSHAGYQRARLRSLRYGQSEKVEWVKQTINAPDVTDRQTLATLAKMAGNAYSIGPGSKNWYDVDISWNNSFPFGRESEAAGFRGHVFTSTDASTVILAIKGTTLQGLRPFECSIGLSCGLKTIFIEGPTSRNDRINDNLLTSCCCARVDLSWVFRTVCDCYSKNWRCDNTCLTNALVEDSLFYSVGVKLVNDLIVMYPTSQIVLVGHSLGGILASLLATTFGFPAVAFEAPGEKLAATRLHLPLPPETSSGYHPVAVTHVYNNADPLPQGACTGVTSWCSQAGFAIETRCHSGKSIVYDAVGKLGWTVDIRKHVIKVLITQILDVEGMDWQDGKEVPEAVPEIDCVDCHKWKFGDFKDV